MIARLISSALWSPGCSGIGCALLLDIAAPLRGTGLPVVRADRLLAEKQALRTVLWLSGA